jgi:hypothetical protein
MIGLFSPLQERMLQAMLATMLLMSLTGNSVCRVDAGTSDRVSLGKMICTTMFPDGLEHDFGKVQAGTQPKHTFRVVNTTSVPLEVSLRRGG